jgi:hypothetical protein
MKQMKKLWSWKTEAEAKAFQYEVGKTAKIMNISFGISHGFHRSQEKVRTLSRVTRNTVDRLLKGLFR